jgi:hypothetical protein
MRRGTDRRRVQRVGEHLGSIRADELMPVRTFCARMGWQRKTLAHAHAVGLRTIRFGKYAYIRGQAALEFFQKLESEAKAAAAIQQGEQEQA